MSEERYVDWEAVNMRKFAYKCMLIGLFFPPLLMLGIFIWVGSVFSDESR